MDMAASFNGLNWLAVLCATLSTFILGGIWYSKLLFAKTWMNVAGMTEESVRKGNMGKIFGGAFLLSFIASINLGMFLGPQSNLAFGLAAGTATGIGWIAPAFGVVYLFEHRPLKQWFINAGYWVVAFIIMGAILGTWH